MVNLETKNKLLKELEKTGNIYISCARAGIDRSTYYEWYKNDKYFKKIASEAIKRGRETVCDIAEHALLQNIKEKRMDAIKYQLSHNSSRYRPKSRKVTIEHSTTGEKLEQLKEIRREHWKQIDEAHKHLVEMLRHQRKFSDQDLEDFNNILPGIKEEILKEEDDTNDSGNSTDRVPPYTA